MDSLFEPQPFGIIHRVRIPIGSRLFGSIFLFVPLFCDYPLHNVDDDDVEIEAW